MDHREFFNEAAERWDEMQTHDPCFISEILDMVGIEPGMTVLDMGTGTGLLIPQIFERTGEEGKVIGVDLAEKMLARARRKYDASQIEFICADVADLPLPDRKVGAVICFSAFPHFPDKEAALREMARVTRSRGKLLIAHPGTREEINTRHQELGGPVQNDLLPDTKLLETMLINTGWSPIKLQNTPYYSAAAARS